MGEMDVLSNKTLAMRCDMYEIGICDDGENICSQLEKYLCQYAKEKSFQFDILVWYSGEELRDYLTQGGHLDILFLDIELFKMSGIEVGNYIRSELDNLGLQLVYISGKSSYAQQLFKTQPLDFLVKPIMYEQMCSTMEMAIKIIRRKMERFEFQQGKDHFYVSQGNIIYFESQGRKIKIVTPNDVYEFYGKLKEIQKDLSEDFLEIHQSYLINRERVQRYTYEAVEMENGDILSISQNKRKHIREVLLRGE